MSRCWWHPLVMVFGTRACLEPSLTLWEASVKIPSLHSALTATWVCLYPSCTHAVIAQPNEPASAAADPFAVLTTALKSLMPNQPATNLNTPTFEWTTSDQYDEFKVFQQSTESWFHLQAIPDEPDNKSAHLEYILNFLSTTGCQKLNQWIPASMTINDICSYQEECKILPGSFSISDGPYCVSTMPNIPIWRCVNQAWRHPRWTGISSEDPCQ